MIEEITINRRENERYPFQEQVDLVSNGVLYEADAVDVSGTGMFLRNAFLNLEDLMTLTYSYGLTPLKKRAKVVRKNSHGIGIQFLLDDVTRIHAIVGAF